VQYHISEILKLRMIRVRKIPDLRVRGFRLLRSGVEEELVYLVGADVAKNAAILLGNPEPVGAT